jgi:hypothetical protein
MKASQDQTEARGMLGLNTRLCPLQEKLLEAFT